MRTALLASAFALLGFAGGYAAFRGPVKRPSSAARVMELGKVAETSESAAAVAASSDDKLLRLVSIALAPGSGLVHDDELYLAISALDRADFLRLAADIGAMKAIVEKLRSMPEEAGTALAEGVTYRFAEAAPELIVPSLQLLLSFVPAGERIRDTIVETLAEQRPEDVLTVALSCTVQKDRAALIKSGLRRLAGTKPETARAWLAQLTTDADRAVAERALRLGKIDCDPLSVVAMLQEKADGTDRNELIREAAAAAAKRGPGVLRQLATSDLPGEMLGQVMMYGLNEQDPAVALEIATKSGKTGDPGYVVRLAFEKIATENPTDALARLEQLGSGGLRGTALNGIASTWLGHDPAGTLDWLRQIPPRDRIDSHSSTFGSNDVLLMTYASWMNREPQAAQAWAQALPAGDVRDSIYAQTARVLSRTGQSAEAARALAEVKAPDANTLTTLARDWATRDPQAAADWALSQPGAQQSQALVGVISTWANHDPAAVHDWIAQFPPGETRDRAVATYLGRGTSLMLDPAAAAAEIDEWLDSTQDPWSRTQIALRGYYGTRERDPEGARRWLQSVPNLDQAAIDLSLKKIPYY